MKRILIFLVFFASLCPVQSQNYSIKNRWNTKLSLSFNRTNYPNDVPLMHWDNVPVHPFQAKLNIRAECNYGVLNWLELGGYLGYIRYRNYYYIVKNSKPPWIYAFAPTFGVNVNVHLLPFFVDNKDCRWEWYVTAKYGGAYLINHVPFSSYYFCSGERYRHEFGIGMGGGVYFWNLFGLYAEALAGQYSYFPEICKVY